MPSLASQYVEQNLAHRQALDPSTLTKYNQTPLIVICYLFTILSGVIVALRFWTRWRILHALAWDDWSMLIALVIKHDAVVAENK